MMGLSITAMDGLIPARASTENLNRLCGYHTLQSIGILGCQPRGISDVLGLSRGFYQDIDTDELQEVLDEVIDVIPALESPSARQEARSLKRFLEICIESGFWIEASY